jgi:geranylgeranyl diphosphate synthase type II
MAIPCALECIHTYSLIHDDLPAMDNDTLRRGKPTNHVVYGEAAAILAGDGLLTYAFDLLSSPAPSWLVPQRQLQIINLIARAAGSLGMVGGQALDIDSEGKEISFETLQTIHRCKTGALITAAVQAGAVLGGADDDEFQNLTCYGNNIGLAFQIVDDMLNVSGTTAELGKTAGSDAEHNKATYPALFGMAETKAKALQAVANAVEALAKFDQRADPLRDLAKYIYTRTN